MPPNIGDICLYTRSCVTLSLYYRGNEPSTDIMRPHHVATNHKRIRRCARSSITHAGRVTLYSPHPQSTQGREMLMIRKCAFLLFAVLLLLPAPALAQAPTVAPRANGALLFAAAFTDASGLEAAFGAEWMTYAAADGIATISSTTPGVVLTAVLAGESFGDFVAEVDLLPGVEPAGTQQGILFRADGPPDSNVNAYSLYVDPSAGSLALDTLVAGGRKEDVVEHGTVALAELPWNAFAPNRLRVEAVGASITVYLNGAFALQAQDTALGAGGMGLTLVSPDDLAPGAAAVARFADLRIYAPGASAPAPTAPSPPLATAPEAPAPTAVAPRPNGDLLFATSFNEPGELEAWPADSSMSYEVRTGVATLASLVTDDLVVARLPDRDFGDFIAEVSITPQDGGEDNMYGFLFVSSNALIDESSAYIFALVPDPGTLDVIYQDTAGSSRQGVNLDTLPFLATGPNRLRIEAVGDTFTVFLNGAYAFTATAKERSARRLGLAVLSGPTASAAQPARADFDLLTIYAVGADAATGAPTTAPTPQPVPTLAKPTATATAPATATPAATLTPTPRPTLKAGSIVGSITSKALRVHDTPGSDTPVIAMLAQGDLVFVEARTDDCAWIKVTALNAKGWVSSAFVELAQSTCTDVPVIAVAATPTPTTAPTATRRAARVNTPTSTPVPTLRPTAAPTVAPTKAPVVVAVATLRPGVVTNFDVFGTWRRGDEAWGTFTQSTEQVKWGTASGRLEYDFPANVPGGKNYVVFSQDRPIAGTPSTLNMAVYGDGSGNFLNVWVADAGGQVWQFTFGQINHTGWRTMTAQLDTSGSWPVGIVSGGSGEKKLDFPIRLHSIVLDYPSENAASGVIYLDTMEAK